MTVTSTRFGAPNRPDGRPLTIRRACLPSQERTIATPPHPGADARRRLRPADGTARRFGAMPRGPSRRPAPDPLRRRWSQETGIHGTHPSGASALPALRSPSGPPGHGVSHREVTDLRLRPERRHPATEGSLPTDGQPRLRPGATRSGSAERASALSTRLFQAIGISTTRAHPAPPPGGARPAENRQQPELFGAPTRPGRPTGAPAPPSP